MRFRFKPESRVQTTTGRVAVGAFLIVTYLTMAGCSDTQTEQSRSEIGRAPTPPASAAPAYTVRPASMITETPVEPTPTKHVVPDNVSYDDAESAFREKRYGEAVELFEVYAEKHSDNVWGHYMLGLSARRSGNSEQAEGAFETALEIDPQHVKTLINLSRVLLVTDRPEEALDKLASVIEIEPESNEAFRLRGVALTDLGRVDEAIESYREAILIDGDDAWTINNLGLALIRLGRFDEALPPLARATELRTDIAVFQNNLGVALEGTGHVNAAAGAFRTALAIDPDHEKAAVSLDRIEQLTPASDVDRVDLTELAQQFVGEIECWRNGCDEFSPETPLPPEVETEPVAAADSSERIRRDSTVVPATEAVETDSSKSVKADSTKSN